MNTILSIALGFDAVIILILIAELRKAKKEASKYKKMYENEKKRKPKTFAEHIIDIFNPPTQTYE